MGVLVLIVPFVFKYSKLSGYSRHSTHIRVMRVVCTDIYVEKTKVSAIDLFTH